MPSGQALSSSSQHIVPKVLHRFSAFNSSTCQFPDRFARHNSENDIQQYERIGKIRLSRIRRFPPVTTVNHAQGSNQVVVVHIEHEL